MAWALGMAVINRNNFFWSVHLSPNHLPPYTTVFILWEERKWAHLLFYAFGTILKRFNAWWTKWGQQVSLFSLEILSYRYIVLYITVWWPVCNQKFHSLKLNEGWRWSNIFLTHGAVHLNVKFPASFNEECFQKWSFGV